jgi:hypothetical protein
MVAAIDQGVEAGRSLKLLVNGFVLTKQTEGKSHRTVEFYSENLKRFLWYASRQGWSDDIRMVTQWHVREFLGYLANEKGRWGLEGNGSESFGSKCLILRFIITLWCWQISSIGWSMKVS